jgi:hypothetical protein
VSPPIDINLLINVTNRIEAPVFDISLLAESLRDGGMPDE